MFFFLNYVQIDEDKEETRADTHRQMLFFFVRTHSFGEVLRNCGFTFHCDVWTFHEKGLAFHRGTAKAQPAPPERRGGKKGKEKKKPLAHVFSHVCIPESFNPLLGTH